MAVLSRLLLPGLSVAAAWCAGAAAAAAEPGSASGGAGGASSSSSTCPAGAGGCSEDGSTETSGSGGPLRWRGFPYKVSNPRFARTIYGGDFVKGRFAASGFEGPEEHDDWDVLWTHKPQPLEQQRRLPPRPGRRLVNHCGYFTAAGDKCTLARLTNSLQGSGPPALRSFELDDAAQLERWRRLALERPEQHWVLKPCMGGGAKGIQIRRGAAALEAQEGSGRHVVAQEYLERPFLGFGSRKFHLRLYILVTRWSPLGAHLFDGGLVFRSVHEHRPGDARDERRDAFSMISQEVEALPLADLWPALAAAGATVPAAEIWDRIKASLLSLMEAGTQQLFGPFEELQRKRSYSCFDLLGADVLLDEALQPFVMEINIGPNMWVDDKGKNNKDLLFSVKQPLMDEVLRWAAANVRVPAPSLEDMERIEGTMLTRFSRLA